MLVTGTAIIVMVFMVIMAPMMVVTLRTWLKMVVMSAVIISWHCF